MRTDRACSYAFSTNTSLGLARAAQFVKRSPDVKMFTFPPPRDSNWSVDCLKQRGYIGMWTSMQALWIEALLRCNKEWLIVFESDALFPRYYLKWLWLRGDIVWLDTRAGWGRGVSGCCTVGMAYHRRIWPDLVFEFNTTNTRAYWNGYASRHKPVVNHPTCLTDWYLGNLAAERRWSASRVGVVQHPVSVSELNTISRS